MNTIKDEFGDIDIYLFDQLLKNKIRKDAKILDAGCGSGRNLHYFLKHKYHVTAIDPTRKSIENVIQLKNKLNSSNTR